MTFTQIITDLKAEKYSPVYFLHGDESYYIDKISSYIQEHALDESEKAFNLHVLYGKDTDKRALIAIASRFPMMAKRQVVIVREAQDIKNLIPKSETEKEKDILLDYILNPVPTTVLVLCHKYKTIDKRTKLAKTIEKNSVLFESKKLYDNKIPDWITDYIHAKKYRINPRNAMMLSKFLGNDLTLISNELEKLLLNVNAGTEITDAHIEMYIGISKDYNNFELQNALGNKDVLKANRIIAYFASNSKNNPMVVTLGTLFSYFSKILIYHSLKEKTRASVASSLGINPYFADEYMNAAKKYPREKVHSIISDLRVYDLKSKGVDNNAEDGELLRELVFKILH
jgi:DNA polymerase-3 subunit delta